MAAPTFYEFFAGGGMARAGLGPDWRCLFANDFDPKKAAAYVAAWGSGDFRLGDVAALRPADLPGRADLAWASFPCQDLSLAGAQAGLGRLASNARTRSGVFWPFWELMGRLASEARGPRLIVLENVAGVLTSHGGRDFAAIGAALAAGGYRFGALALDAADFVAQSRPRIFFVAVADGLAVPQALLAPDESHAPAALRRAWRGLPDLVKQAWLWWDPPAPPLRARGLGDLIEAEPQGVAWHEPAATLRLLGLMAPLHRAKVAAAQACGRRMVGALYRRTRPDGAGGRIQRAEVRFDDMAGCLRTPAGGSSRQTILVVEGGATRSRLLSAREAARLMGLPDDHALPARYNDAYHLLGDGVCVPLVRHLARHLLEPVLGCDAPRAMAAE